MGTSRPTIHVDDLDVDSRPWPKGANQDYDTGSRYCFRVGKMDYEVWKWPWPEWIGIPTRENIKQWLELIKYWRTANTGKYDNYQMDICITGLLRYL